MVALHRSVLISSSCCKPKHPFCFFPSTVIFSLPKVPFCLNLKRLFDEQCDRKYPLAIYPTAHAPLNKDGWDVDSSLQYLYNYVHSPPTEKKNRNK